MTIGPLSKNPKKLDGLITLGLQKLVGKAREKLDLAKAAIEVARAAEVWRASRKSKASEAALLAALGRYVKVRKESGEPDPNPVFDERESR